jgi:diphosphomevalonate decarboxylase
MSFENPSLVLHTPGASGSVAWRSPSNLAIVKYWGKHGNQLPRNPSLSLTLSESYTETKIDYRSKEGKGIELNFAFEGNPNKAFEYRIKTFLSSIVNYFPFINQLEFSIESKNSFPHSSGIASSASSMSALALGLCSIERDLFGSLDRESEFLKKASYISRLGSGSASRSVYSDAAIWGQIKGIGGSSDLFAIPWSHNIHKEFKTYKDAILIVSPEKKKVSSSAGHQLMEGNIYASARYEQAKKRLLILTEAMKEGDLATFGKISEDEALTLHALMMCSDPSYMLIEPGSVGIMKAVREFREQTKLPVYFSLDAGPNIHLLYPEAIEKDVEELIEEKLAHFCTDKRIIYDKVGSGPSKI